MKHRFRAIVALTIALPVIGAGAWLATRPPEPDNAPGVSASPAAGASEIAASASSRPAAENRVNLRATESNEIQWGTNYEAALAAAKEQNKLVVVDFYATWCGPCKLMEQNTFTDERVRERMAGFIPLKVDVDRQRDLAAQYGITSLPTTAVLAADGKPITGAMGYLKPEQFLQLLDSPKAEGQEPV
ncbi:MAG: thioredoxin fold domain-containing protein [bacterium]|nr:thioredoxin fold domain-containing protein [bacterium]